MRRIRHGAQRPLGEDCGSSRGYTDQFWLGGPMLALIATLTPNRTYISSQPSRGSTCRRIRYRMFSQPGGLWAKCCSTLIQCRFLCVLNNFEDVFSFEIQFAHIALPLDSKAFTALSLIPRNLHSTIPCQRTNSEQDAALLWTVRVDMMRARPSKSYT